MASFDYKAAQKAGYSEGEILDYLEKDYPDFDVKKARQAGYSLDEIGSHLNPSKKVKGYDIDPKLASEYPEETIELYPHLFKKKPARDEKAIKERLTLDVPAEMVKKAVEENPDLAGYEPDFAESQERMMERGFAERGRGIYSGFTFGASESLPGLETSEGEAAITGKMIGSFLPLSKMIGVIEGPVMTLATKSPVFQRQIASLLTMFGVGSADKAINTVLEKGETPSVDEVLEHGTAWAALDAVLMTLGATGRFAKSLLSKSTETGLSRTQLVNEVTRQLEESGVDMTNPEAVGNKAFEILDQMVAQEEQLAALAVKKEAERAAAEKTERIAAGKTSPLAGKSPFEGGAPEPKPTVSPMEETIKETEGVAKEAIKEEVITPKDLKTRKVSDEAINRLTTEVRILSEAHQPGEVNLSKEVEKLEETTVQNKLEKSGERALTEEDLGAAVKQDIETGLEAAKDEYRPLYDQAEKAAKKILHKPKGTAKETGNKLKKMSKLKTKPEGYGSVLQKFEDVLEDVGYKVQRDEEGAIEHILAEKPVLVSDSIELARRLNEIINFEAVEPTVKDALRSVVRALKRDIRKGLSRDPDALAAFELAEKAHAATAKRFSKDSILRIRGQQAEEKIAKMAQSPSTFRDLKDVLSPKQMAQVERELLERMNKQNYEQAKKTLREFEKHISDKNKKLAREIVEAKNPQNTLGRKKIIQEGILEDVSNAFTTGQRPKKTLDLWKTTKGQKLVKEAFHNSPNWPKVKSYLEKQSFNDMVESVLNKNGRLDVEKFKKFMKDPANVNNIEALGGEEAVDFFLQLDSKVAQMERNSTALLEKFPKDETALRGKEILRKGRERVEQRAREAEEAIEAKKKPAKVGERALKEQRARKEESTGEIGDRILERMVQKDFPILSKAKKWKEWFAETMGLTPRGALSVFSLMKFGIPNTVATLIGYKIFNTMATSPRVRKAFLEAAKHHTDPLKFMIAMERLGEAIDEAEEK
jgi:hypothetical protein